MSLTRKERKALRLKTKEALKAYARTHSPEEYRRHRNALFYPSGRWSHGGANRSSNIKREVCQNTVTISLCGICDGVSQEILELTSLFPACNCGPFRI